MRRFVAFVCACLGVFVLAVLLLRVTRPRISGATVIGDDVTRWGGHPRAIELPFLAGAPTSAPMEITFHVRATAWTQKSFVIIPDDKVLSISVNGTDEPLSSVDPQSLSDVSRGFRYPLGRDFHPGDNVVVIHVQNTGGPGGLDVHPDPTERRDVLAVLAGAAALIALFVLSLRRAGWTWATTGIAAAGTALRFAYLAVTPFLVRAHDPSGHIDYAQFLLQHHALPKPSAGYSFFHPPLYYTLAALQWAALRALGFVRAEILESLQLLSVLFDVLFSVIAVATVRLWIETIPAESLGRRLFGREGLTALAAALIFFWPSSVLHSARIGNDDLTYVFIGAGLYYASRFWLHGGRRDAVLACLAAALGVVTKTNSLLVFVVLMALLAVRLFGRYRAGRPLGLRGVALRSLLPAGLLVGSTVLALGRSIADTLAGHQGKNVLVPNAHWNSDTLLVGNRAENYLWLDVRSFVTQAFTSPYADEKGRQFFWNYLLKTSLFGEWEYPGAWAWNLGVILSLLLLAIVVSAVWSNVRSRGAVLHRELPLLLVAGGLVASLAALRMAIPDACSGDFRYVLPVLVPLVWWLLRSITEHRAEGRTRVAVAGVAVGWLFAAVSAAFVLVVVLTS